MFIMITVLKPSGLGINHFFRETIPWNKYPFILTMMSVIFRHNTVHNQCCTELEVNSTEQANNRNDIRRFRIRGVKSNVEEFIHSYTFIWTEYIEGVCYLCVDMAEYDLLRGQELNMFNRMMEKSLSLEIGDKKCTLKQERMNYQKRRSKRNHKDVWYSCSKDYSALKKQLQESGCDKDEIAELVKLHSLFLRI